MRKKEKMMVERPARLEDYLKTLRRSLKSARQDFWKDTRAAEEAFHREMTAAVREYEKIAYLDKRVSGALTEAAKSLNDRHDASYRVFGEATKGALQRLEKKIEELLGP